MLKQVTHTTLIAAALGLTGLAATATALASSPSNSARQASIPACRTSDLSAKVEPGSPGAGQRYGTLVLTNLSDHTCHTYGYVGMLFLDRRHRPVATHVIRDRSVRPRRVVLAPGGHAATLLHWSIVQGTGDQTGPCVTAPRYVEITPPDETTHRTIRWRGGTVCERGTISVQTLVPAHF